MVSRLKELLQTRHLFGIILALGLFIMAARPVSDPDLWWHLRSGELIVHNHQLFHADPYSFTRSGRPWVDHEWLSQILIFGLYRAAAWGGLIAGFALIIAAAFLILFLRSPGRPYVAGVIATWGAVASIPSWGARPQMLTLLLASILLLILERSYQHSNLLWWTPPLILLWVNLHAGYALGIALMVLFLLGDALDIVLGCGESVQSTARFRNLVFVLVACVAVIPLNPYGAQIYRYPFETLRSRAMQAYIGEWLSPDFHQPRYLPTLLMILATLALPALSPRRLRPRELLLLLVTMYAGLRSVRHAPIYVLVAVPLLSGTLQARLEQAPKPWAFTIEAQRLTRLKMGVNSFLLAGFLIFTAARLYYVINRQPEIESHEFPAAAASFLAQTRPAAPLMNHYNWGGYFIWELYPEYKVYIDGRADLYGDKFIDEFASTYYVKGRSWKDPLQKWNIQTVVLPPDAPLVTALRAMPAWRAAFADRQAVVLIKLP